MISKKTEKIPSIEEIQLVNERPNRHLSEDDVHRLFRTNNLPKFELGELKSHSQFTKYRLYQFFIEYLESWNRKLKENEQQLNFRMQRFCSEFIYCQLKRLMVSNVKNIQLALSQLYKWFEQNSKSDKFSNAFMPVNKKNEEDEWEIRKTFKHNTALQINGYKRKFLCPCPQYENSTINGGFITCPKANERSRTFDPIEKAISYKLKQEQLRKVREMKEIQEKEAEWKSKKTRFEEESMKNYYKGVFNTTIRFSKTAYGQRKKNIQFDAIKKARVNSTLKLKKHELKRQPLKENIPLPENIGGGSLIKNPLEIKIKTKNKKKKK